MVSKPEFLPTEVLFLLIHQTYDHPEHKNLKKSYETNKINSILNDFEISTEARDFLNENLFNVFVEQKDNF